MTVFGGSDDRGGPGPTYKARNELDSGGIHKESGMEMRPEERLLMGSRIVELRAINLHWKNIEQCLEIYQMNSNNL